MPVDYAYISFKDPSEDLKYLESRGVTDFVHFTTVDNLPGILKEGLCPRAQLEELGINYTSTDKLRLEGKGYVNLSITNPNIKMFYGKRKDLKDHLFVVLTLDPALLHDAMGSYEFRSTNAASRFAQPCNVEEVFSGSRPDFFEPNWPTDNQAEVLLASSIKPSYIKTIQFPYSDIKNPSAIAAAESIADMISELDLQCNILFCDKLFDYNKSVLGQLEPKLRYEYYFVSWTEDEQAAVDSEESIRLIEKRKEFDSIALHASKLKEEPISPDKEVEPAATWTMRYHAPAEPLGRTNAQLSAFAVIEKIVNRGRRTRLSEKLENQLSSDDEVARAHQVQCALVELIKHQTLRPGNGVYCEADGRLGDIVQAALEDLQELSANVCRLYRCEDFLADIIYSRSSDSFNISLSWSDDSSDIEFNEVRISSFKEATGMLPFDFTRVVEPVPIKSDYEVLHFLLKYVFRFDGFREGQLEAIRRGLSRLDTIVLLPTGSGKSVVFQLLSLITPGISFVVCPIISLIEDQIVNLRYQGIDRIIGISSATDSSKRNDVLSRITTGQYLMCYVAPERFQNKAFIKSVTRYSSTNLISTIAVDEAHCVSEWGHDFRTAYLGLAHTCREVCKTEGAVPPLLALTGTASMSVLLDMMSDLEIDDEYAIIQPESFDRPEIHYRVIRVRSDQKRGALERVINELIPKDFHSTPADFFAPAGEDSNCGIVFCPHTSGQFGLMGKPGADSDWNLGVWDFMDKRLPGLCSYYSGKAPKCIKMSESKWSAEKRAQASSFKNNETTVMVATKAFGMGIDKPNVRWIVHYGMPGSLESYYQEVGRAARDRKPAYAYLLLSDDFHDLNEELLDPSRTPITEMQEQDSYKGKRNGDDISRMVFFHSSAFSGVESELKAAKSILDACTKQNFTGGEWYVPFNNDTKAATEKAIYRFRLLGVFDSYTIEYRYKGGRFIIRPTKLSGKKLRNHIIDSYIDYIKSYQSDRAYVSAARRNIQAAVSDAVDDRDFIMRAVKHLLSEFVYKVLEEGRRRATKTMLDAACKAADAKNDDAVDQELRSQMLAYLSTGGKKGKKRGIRSLLNNATNTKLIMELLNREDRTSLLGQASRLLEDYPEHYGLHFIQAAVYALDGDEKGFGPALRSMVSFGTRNYGLSREQCKEYFIAFFNSPIAEGIQAEELDRQLVTMTEAFDCGRSEILDAISSKQAAMLKEVDELYMIAVKAMEGLQWIQAK